MRESEGKREKIMHRKSASSLIEISIDFALLLTSEMTFRVWYTATV